MRFFADETDLKLAKELERGWGDVVYPGHADLPEVPKKAPDEVWLPVVGDEQLVVVTSCKRIRYRPVEKALWVKHNVRGFVLTGISSQTTADSLAILGDHRLEIETIIARRPTGPWMYAVTGDRSPRELSLGG